jgi:hypothetical protein
MTAATSSELPDISRRVLRLQVLTIVWMTGEAVISLVAEVWQRAGRSNSGTHGHEFYRLASTCVQRSAA